jgi:hypothetical protein
MRSSGSETKKRRCESTHVLDERIDGVVCELVLEDDEAWRLGSRVPLLQACSHLVECRAAGCHAPILGAGNSGQADAMMVSTVHVLLVPDDRSHTEDLLGDGGDTGIRVTEGRAPVSRETAAGQVTDGLHSVAKLSDDVLIRERLRDEFSIIRVMWVHGEITHGHVRVGPGVNGDVVLERLIRCVELRDVVDDVDADKEVSRALVLGLQEVVEEVGGALKKQ